MENSFILHMLTKEISMHESLKALLLRENVPYELLCRTSSNKRHIPYYHVEGLYCVVMEHSCLNNLKKIIDANIVYEKLALYEYVSW